MLWTSQRAAQNFHLLFSLVNVTSIYERLLSVRAECGFLKNLVVGAEAGGDDRRGGKKWREGREWELQSDRQDEKERERSDKSHSGKLELICFYDESGTPRMWFQIFIKIAFEFDIFSISAPHSIDLLLSLSASIYLPICLLVYSSLFLLSNSSTLFPSHPSVVSYPARLCLLWCTFLLPFLCFSHTLPPSLLVFVPISFMSPFFISTFFSPLSFPVLSSHLPPILLPPASLSPSLLLSPNLPPPSFFFASSSLIFPPLKCITVI